jgi:cytochrome c biogenesis protein CcdA
VIDLLGESLRAVGTRSALAYPLVLGAGVVTSVGPCAAPRYVAVAALAHATRAPWTIVAAFAAGLVAAYVALGALASGIGTAANALGSLWSASSYVYGALATALLAGGVFTLVRASGTLVPDPCEPRTGCDAPAACGGASETTMSRANVSHGTAASRTTSGGTAASRTTSGGTAASRTTSGGTAASRTTSGGAASFGGVFLLGASSVLVVSPCCTPVVAGIAGLTLATGRALDGVALLAVFACGHAVPVAFAGALGDRFASALRRLAASQAPAIVSGALMIALAVYYGVLA